MQYQPTLYLSERVAHNVGTNLIRLGKIKRYKVRREVVQNKDFTVDIGYRVVPVPHYYEPKGWTSVTA